MSQGIKDKTNKIIQLKPRTFEFSKKAIDLVILLPRNVANDTLAKQFLRSATSIGANYPEADGTGSRKDLKYKMTLIRKETKETYYWLGLIPHSNQKSNSEVKVLIQQLIQESKELTLIFSKIVLNIGQV